MFEKTRINIRIIENKIKYDLAEQVFAVGETERLEGGAEGFTCLGATSSGPLSNFPCNMVSALRRRSDGLNILNRRFSR